MGMEIKIVSLNINGANQPLELHPTLIIVHCEKNKLALMADDQWPILSFAPWWLIYLVA